MNRRQILTKSFRVNTPSVVGENEVTVGEVTYPVPGSFYHGNCVRNTTDGYIHYLTDFIVTEQHRNGLISPGPERDIYTHSNCHRFMVPNYVIVTWSPSYTYMVVYGGIRYTIYIYFLYLFYFIYINIYFRPKCMIYITKFDLKVLTLPFYLFYVYVHTSLYVCEWSEIVIGSILFLVSFV